jgi:exonuclease-1
VKLDKSGFGKQYEFKKLSAHPLMDFRGWDLPMFLNMCILSGCDYLPSINGMGIKNAHKYVGKYKEDMKRVISLTIYIYIYIYMYTYMYIHLMKLFGQLFQMLRMEGKFSIPAGYQDKFTQAKLTFLHQRVWDPCAEEIGKHLLYYAYIYIYTYFTPLCLCQLHSRPYPLK